MDKAQREHIFNNFSITYNKHKSAGCNSKKHYFDSLGIVKVAPTLRTFLQKWHVTTVSPYICVRPDIYWVRWLNKMSLCDQISHHLSNLNNIKSLLSTKFYHKILNVTPFFGINKYQKIYSSFPACHSNYVYRNRVFCWKISHIRAFSKPVVRLAQNCVSNFVKMCD